MRQSVRRGTVLVCLSIAFSFCLSQAQPEWVKTAAREAQGVSVDEMATEIVVYSTQNVEIDSDGESRAHIRIMTKLLKTPGRYSGMLQEWKTGKRDISHLKGWRFPAKGEPEELEDANVVEVAPSDIASYFDEHQVFIANFPAVAAGDIIAYEYDVENSDWPATYQVHTFQNQQPVHFSEFTLTLPDNWDLHKSEWNLDSVAFTREGNKYRWTARDLPMRPEEKLMPSWSYLERRLTVFAYNVAGNSAPHFSDWKSVAGWVGSICDPAIEPADTGLLAVVTRITAGQKSTEGKIRAAEEYVRDNIRYVAVEVGKGRWEPHQSGSIFFNKYGDCKDKATLLRTMLRALNIPSYAVLAQTEYEVHPNLPSPFQFNHCIVAIPLSAADSLKRYSGAVAGRWIFCDPTDEVNPFGALPVQLQGSRVLVGADGDSLLVKLPLASPEENRRTCTARAMVQENGTLLAAVRIVYEGVMGQYQRYRHKTMSKEDQLKSFEQFYTSQFPDIKISDYTAGFDNDSAWVTFRLAAMNGVRRSGNALLLKPNLFPSREFPSLPKTKRQHPVWFGGPELTRTTVSVEIPPAWKFDEVVPPQFDSCKDVAHLRYSSSTKKNTLLFTASVDNDGSLIEASEIDAVKAYSRRMRAYSELTIIIKTP